MTSLRPFLVDDIQSVMGKLSFRLIAAKKCIFCQGKYGGKMVKDVVCNMENDEKTSKWKPGCKGKYAYGGQSPTHHQFPKPITVNIDEKHRKSTRR